MKKSILNLDGAQELTRKEQKNINGGGIGTRCIGTDVSVCGVPPAGAIWRCIDRKCTPEQLP